MDALGPIECLFLLGPLAVVPLALRLAAPGSEAPWALSAARRLQPWAATLVVASFLVGRRGTRLSGWAAILLSISSVSILGGMACAAYAVGEFTGIGTISLGQMARIHGPLNGLGFALAGLLGWTLAPRNLRLPAL